MLSLKTCGWRAETGCALAYDHPQTPVRALGGRTPRRSIGMVVTGGGRMFAPAHFPETTEGVTA